jgi:[ribosomal protein S5]-alanine N-acetyltransferase
MLSNVRLETTRLVLREISLDDVDAIHAYAANPDVVQYMVWGPNSFEQTRKFCAERVANRKDPNRTSYELAINVKPGSVAVGALGLRVKSVENREGELGYVLHPVYWGKGYMTEAAQRMLDFGFDELKLHRISAFAAPENAPSLRVLTRLGMTYEGTLRQNVRVKYGYRDSALYAILSDERRITPKGP